MINRMRSGLLPAAVALALAAPAVVMAQNVTSSALTGAVVDASGQPVAGATVTIVHEPSGTTRTVTTNESGRYTAQGLRVGGPYEVSVSKAGVPGTLRSNVFLQLGQVNAINLQMGASEQDAQELATITVRANALSQVFSPDNMGVGTNISQREIESMPTPGRSIQDLVRLDPRVNIVSRSEGKISALGQNFRYNNITVDSVSVNDPFGLNPNGLPVKGTAVSQDTIAAYNISTANYDVTTRRGLGVDVNAVTKSGTNEYHGSVYYVYQNDDWIGKFQDSDFTGYDRKWTGGATFGGPIVKDKLFFFVSYEQSEQDGAGTSWGPTGSGAAQQVEGLTVDDLNQIREIAAQWGMGDIGALTGGNVLQDKRYLAKIDWNISNNHRASLTWRRTKEFEPRPRDGYPGGLTLSSGWTMQDTDIESYALHLYDDWSSNFSSKTTLSWSKFTRDAGPYTGVDMPAITVHVGGFRGPSVDFGTNYSYQANKIDTKTLYAAWAGTYFAGDHQIKFGFDYQKDEKYNLFLQNHFGSYSFDTIEDFANGSYSTRYFGRPADGLRLDDVAASFTLEQIGFFVQDTWQVDNNLSLRYGVRFDQPRLEERPLYNPTFAEAGFTTPDGKVLTTNQYTLGDTLIEPRLSFNYQFDTDLMMQLRGGVGLFMTNTPAVWIGNIYSNTGMNAVSYKCQTFRGCDGPDFSPDPYNQPDGVPGSSQMTVNTLDPDFHLPTSWKFSLGFDAELPWMGMIGSLEYEQVKVKHAIWYQNLNLGAPTGILPDGRLTYYNNPYTDPRGDGNYDRANANGDFTDEVINLASTNKGRADNWTFSLKKPFKDGWSAMVGITWNNATDVNAGLSSVAESSWNNNFMANPNANVLGTSNYETEWRAIAAFSWRHAFFGDYYTKFSAFYDGRTGHPFSWAFGNDSNGDGISGNDLVYIPNPGEVLFREGTTQAQIDGFYNYINSTDYLSSHQGSIASRNGDRAPWFNQLDLSFSQEIPGIFEGHKGEIRFDIYNFLNLLDKDWGTELKADYPGYRSLADYYGVDPETGKYIYDITGSSYTDENGNYRPDPLPYNTYPNDRSQRWAVQLTVRYKF